MPRLPISLSNTSLGSRVVTSVRCPSPTLLEVMFNPLFLFLANGDGTGGKVRVQLLFRIPR
jgi:hypothetical protein